MAAKLLIWIGAVLLALGLLLGRFPGLFHWFGRLPGDIRIENEHGFLLVPITSMLVISALVTLIINVFLHK